MDGMEKRKTDRRVKYTKMVLRQSLLELMKTKSIDQISVTDLCAHADINRGTFYTHYNTPHDLLRQIEDELYNVLEETLIRHRPDVESLSTYEVILQIVRGLSDNADLCKVILGKHGDSEFLRNVLHMAQMQVFSVWASRMQDKPEWLFPYLYGFVANGSVGIIQHWISRNMKEKPEDIAMMIHNMANIGIQKYIENKT